MNTHPQHVKVLAALALAAGALPAWSQTTFIKADNTTSLNFASSYTSNTTVPTSADTIQVDTTLTANRTAALGANLTVNAITYNSTFQFQISNTANAVLTIGAGGVTKTGGSGMIFANAVTLGANQTWTTTAGSGNLQMNGAFNDGGKTLLVTGNGTFDLRGNNTFSSNVTIATTSVNINGGGVAVTFAGNSNTFDSLLINAGKLSGSTIGNYGVASSFGDGGTNSTITLGGGSGANGTFEYTGNSASTNRTFTLDQRSTGSAINVATSGQKLTITSNLLYSSTQAVNTNWNFGGEGNLAIAGNIAETSNATLTVGVVKTGNGTLTLSGNNTYAGTTAVNVGTLLVNNTTGSGTGSSSVTVSAGATLGGTGLLTPGAGNSITVNGTIAPGDGGINTLTFNGSSTAAALATFGTGAGFSFDINATSVTSDRLALVGGAAGDFVFNGNVITFTLTGALSNGQTYILFSSDVANAYSGLTFDGLNKVTSGLSFTGLGGAYDTNSYISLVGNNLVLNAVPEPSTWLLAGLGLAGIAILRRRSSMR